MMTTCALPPEPDDVQLAMFLDGETDPTLAEHLAACAHCRTRLDTLVATERVMVAHLARLHCPATDALRDYYFGFLDDPAADALSDHLRNCPHCLRELALLGDYLGPETTAPYRAPDLTATLSPRMRMVAVAPTADGDATRNRIVAIGPEYTFCQAGDLHVRLHVIQTAPRLDRPYPAREVQGLLMDDDPGAWQAHLWQADRLRASCRVDDLGGFLLALPAGGALEIVLAGPDRAVRIAAEARP